MNRKILILAVVGILVTGGCLGGEISMGGESGVEDDNQSTEPTPADESVAGAVDGEVQFHHIDVGQGDATLIVTPSGETILIDTGDWRQDGQHVISYMESHDIDRIDHLVGTHPHADHIGGHAAVIAHFEDELDGIGAVYDSGVAHTSQTYENYLDAVEAYDVELFITEEGDQLPIEDDGVIATVHNPPAGDSGTDLHYNSIALAISVGEITYLTTGDTEADAEDRVVSEWGDEIESDIYHAGHHGSSTSSSEPFMNAVQPDFAIISSGFESQYGHPHDEVLELFAEMDIETYWTGIHGDIVFTTDGTSIDVTSTDDATTDPAEILELKPRDDDSERIGAMGHHFDISTPALAYP
ncbi:MBL fold metallo-hydrolase [Halorubraceae archaeon YAN]|nr:MBL fold metallo-hydrolase [Halorubraceae archaeon YAN]